MQFSFNMQAVYFYICLHLCETLRESFTIYYVNRNRNASRDIAFGKI